MRVFLVMNGRSLYYFVFLPLLGFLVLVVAGATA